SGSRTAQVERSLKRCEAFLRQEVTPGRVLAPFAYAEYLRARGEYAKAAEAYARALGPARVGEADSPARVRAAMAAARASAGAGSGVDPGRRERWLGLALGWLRDASADWRDRVERDPVRDLPGVRGGLEALLLCG